jgi:hypothetical protein
MAFKSDIHDQGSDCYTRESILRTRGGNPKGSWYALKHKKGKEDVNKK